MTTDIPSQPRRLDHLLLVVILLCCAMVLSRNHADPDLWGHVRYGQDALRLKDLPKAATYTYTAEGHPWINHENLSELALAVGMEHLGPPVVLTIKCLLGVLLLLLVAHQARRSGVSDFAVYLALLLTAVNLMFFWMLRPQLASFALFGLLVFLLQISFRDWRDHWRLPWRSEKSAKPPRLDLRHQSLQRLWLSPLLFLLWANSHGGFVAGLAIFAAYLGLRVIEAWSQYGQHAVQVTAFFATVWFASAATTLVSPYGHELHLWLLESLGSPRPEILEWRAPELFSIVWVPFWVLVAAFVVSLLASRQSKDFTHTTILLLALWQSIAHLRHIPFFTILFAFWMPLHLQSALRRVGLSQQGSLTPGLTPIRRIVFSLLLVAAATTVGMSLQSQLRQVVVKRANYPVSCFEWMRTEGINGKLVLRFKWAQYAIAALVSDEHSATRVAFDGRFRTCYPQEVVDMYFDFALGDDPTIPRSRSVSSPPVDPERILRIGAPDLVMVDRSMPSPRRVMSAQKDWSILYQDRLVQLWGRRDRYDEPSSPDYLSPQRRRIGEEPQIGHVDWPALPRPKRATELVFHQP